MTDRSRTTEPAEGNPSESLGGVSPESPEARARRRNRLGRQVAKVRPGTYPFEVLKRVGIGVYSDGFIHAGNIAYLALLTLFPFFIVALAIASILGRSDDGLRTVNSFLETLPNGVADLLRAPILQVLKARTGSLLWLGALVGLWTVGSFIETIRDILRRAYGTTSSQPFWHYRLGSVAIIVVSVMLALISFVAQGVLTAAEQIIYRLLPWAQDIAGWIGLSRLVPAALMFGALYLLFLTLTPSKYRYGNCPKWPGALLVTVWWLGTTALLPMLLAQLGGYEPTYGGLAGTIVALFFFWTVGLGIVVGAHLNAALAETVVPDIEDPAVST
ncbi:YihY/virulence factor BrkB family protein [Sphingomonas prati]|uniref:Membrane protein n=1 Tax=Sphingomonas prati TaxID=1843237 RepID=A0A7W9BTC9_9SPHN|nr:YihY/virulence factor BrkB family protein [Sphingomonas prati]MBB5729764.1 membrane protein [Sphingomonas prati]GGE89697.1 hypothetical protein GCM10011404_23210 [Sphingomonas prati]